MHFALEMNTFGGDEYFWCWRQVFHAEDEHFKQLAAVSKETYVKMIVSHNETRNNMLFNCA